MARFPDAPADRVLRALAALGFAVVRSGNHISPARTEPDGTVTPMTLPGHPTLKAGTLRAALTQSGVSRDDFLRDRGYATWRSMEFFAGRNLRA